MGADYRENPSGIAAMLAAPWMVAALRDNIGEPVKEHAKRNTPVLSGRMKRSWHVHAAVRNGRAWVRIYNTARDPKTGYPYPRDVEHGNSRMRRQRVLGRALDAVLGPGTTTR